MENNLYHKPEYIICTETVTFRKKNNRYRKEINAYFIYIQGYCDGKPKQSHLHYARSGYKALFHCCI